MSGLTLSVAIQQQMTIDAYLSSITNTALTLTATKVEQFEQRIEEAEKDKPIPRWEIIDMCWKFAKMKDYFPNLIEKSIASLSIDSSPAEGLQERIKAHPLLKKAYVKNAAALKKYQMAYKIENLIKSNHELLSYGAGYAKNGCCVITNSTSSPRYIGSDFVGTINKIAFDFCFAYTEEVAKNPQNLRGISIEDFQLQVKAANVWPDLLEKRVKLANCREQLWMSWDCDALLLEHVRKAVNKDEEFKQKLLNTGSNYILYMGGIDALTTYAVKNCASVSLDNEDAYTSAHWSNGEGKNMMGRSLMRVRKECGGTGEVVVPKSWELLLKDVPQSVEK